MSKPAKRFYITPQIRFDIHQDKTVIMYYMGEEVSRKKLDRTYNTDVMEAFSTELGPLATGSPIPMPSTMPAIVERKTIHELTEEVEKLTKRVGRIEKRVKRRGKVAT